MKYFRVVVLVLVIIVAVVLVASSADLAYHDNITTKTI
jgi:hypothetical protein